MNISPSLLGFVRVLAYVGITAVVSYVADVSHLHGIVNEGIAVIIAGLAGMLEHKLEANGSGALFGAVKSTY